MDASLMAWLKQLETDNQRLKKMCADERLSAEIIQEAMVKKVVRPSQRCEMAKQAVAEHSISIRFVCAVFIISETCYRSKRKLSAENVRIADRLIRLTDNQRNWGFGLCFLFLRNVKGFR